MRRFAHAAVLAIAISGPVLAGALIDQSVVSVLGDPSGPVGGALGGTGAENSDGKANGGKGTTFTIVDTQGHETQWRVNGTFATGGLTGRVVATGTNPVPGTTGTFSGNATNDPDLRGHCTGAFC